MIQFDSIIKSTTVTLLTTMTERQLLRWRRILSDLFGFNPAISLQFFQPTKQTSIGI